MSLGLSRLSLSLGSASASPTYGQEVVSNGTFDSDTAWMNSSSGSGTATISGGVLSIYRFNSSNKGGRTQSISLLTMALYQVRFTFSGANGFMSVGSSGWGVVLAPGTYTRYFVALAASDTVFLESPSDGATVTMDDISIRRVLRGTIGSNLAAGTYSMTGGTESPTGTLNLNGTGQTGDKSFTTVVGQPYRIRFTGGANVSTVRVGTSAGGTQNLAAQTGVVGSNEYFFVATATTSWIRFAGTAAGAGTVSAIEVASITP